MISNKAKGLSNDEHIKKSIIVGMSGERDFLNAAINNAMYCEKSTENEDIFKHIDFYLDGETVDVKGFKSSHSAGYVIVEFKNVNGKDGWCSESSMAKFIAFQFKKEFLLVRNVELLSYCRANVKNEYVDRFNVERIYKKLYSRKNRSDLMTSLKREDLEGFNYILKIR